MISVGLVSFDTSGLFVCKRPEKTKRGFTIVFFYLFFFFICKYVFKVQHPSTHT